jgi:hypothetical protein
MRWNTSRQRMTAAAAAASRLPRGCFAARFPSFPIFPQVMLNDRGDKNYTNSPPLRSRGSHKTISSYSAIDAHFGTEFMTRPLRVL